MRGEIGILNVGAGDTKLVFDPNDKAGTQHAARVVKDMLERGYAIFVQVGENDRGPIYQRATGFDENTHEYLIAGTPPAADEEKVADVKVTASAPRRGRKATKAAPRRVPAGDGTKAVAVARVAGG